MRFYCYVLLKWGRCPSLKWKKCPNPWVFYIRINRGDALAISSDFCGLMWCAKTDLCWLHRLVSADKIWAGLNQSLLQSLPSRAERGWSRCILINLWFFKMFEKENILRIGKVSIGLSIFIMHVLILLCRILYYFLYRNTPGRIKSSPVFGKYFYVFLNFWFKQVVCLKIS